MQKDQPINGSITFRADNASMDAGSFAKIFASPSSVTTTPFKLLQQINQLKARIDALKAAKSVRSKRDIPELSEFKSVIVNRLWINNNTFQSKCIFSLTSCLYLN